MEKGEMKNNGGEVNGLYENLREWVKEKWLSSKRLGHWVKNRKYGFFEKNWIIAVNFENSVN